MRKVILLCIALVALLELPAQNPFARTYYTHPRIGLSAISVDTLYSNVLHVTYPVYEYVEDTVNAQVIFSCRQKGEGYDNVYLNKGGFAAIDYYTDTLNYKNETALYSLDLAPGSVLASKENKTVVFHRALGYDQQRFNARVVYTFTAAGKGLIYPSQRSDSVQCVDLTTGNVNWTANIPRAQEWPDVQALNDSVIIIAASGISAVHIGKGLLWHQPLKTAVTNTGSLTYSLARHKTIKKLSHSVNTAINDSLVSHLSSNILIYNGYIYFSGREEALCIAPNGTVRWRCDLLDYDPAMSLLTPAPEGIYLVNFGMGVHAGNYVIRNTPYLLTLDTSSGELVDQYDLKEIDNLADFMLSARGLSFGGKEKILEMTKSTGFSKTSIPLGKIKYGAFSEFINGDEYYCLREGHYVPLNFINDQIIYFLADNNKIYGLEGEKLLYEYHFTELFHLIYRYGDKRILSGLTTTVITDRNFELLATLDISEKSVLLKDKLYFIDNEKIYIVDLSKVR